MRRPTLPAIALPATVLALTLVAGCTPAEETEAPVIEAQTAEPTEAEEAPSLAEDVEPTEAPGGPGVYRASMMGGATATVAAPGTPPADIEQFRVDTGHEEVGYLVVEVDNREGAGEALLFEAKIVDTAGETYTYEDVGSAIWDWDGGDIALMERGLDLMDEYPYSVLPPAKATVPMIGPEVPEDIAAVYVEGVRADRVGDL